MILTGLKVALLIAVSGAFVFSAVYTWLTRGVCWRDPVGLTVQLETIFLGLAFVPLLLAAFFQFSVTENTVGSWVLISFIGLAGLVLFWRTAVFLWEDPRLRRLPHPRAGVLATPDRKESDET